MASLPLMSWRMTASTRPASPSGPILFGIFTGALLRSARERMRNVPRLFQGLRQEQPQRESGSRSGLRSGVVLGRFCSAVLLDARDTALHGGSRGIHLARADRFAVGGVENKVRFIGGGLPAHVVRVLG